MLENVEEFQTWGPLAADMKPDPAKKGRTFQRWISSLRKLGYKVEWKELRACDYGAPTIRKRLFIVARCDGQPIIWPSATHGDPKKPSTKACNLKPWKTAAECIDWSIPSPSIFERKKPLADNTLRRIAHGIVRYVINANEPFIVETAHSDVSPSGVKRWGKGVRSLKEPLTTITASGNGAALCTTFLAKHYSGVVGHGVKQPLGTITTADHHSVVAAHMVNLRGTSTAHGVTEPAKTITAGGNHAGLVAALLVKYYGNERDGVDITEPMHTIPTKDRFGLITVQINGEPHFITDICLRMFQPRELYRAQGFSDDYIIDRQSDGTPITKTAQTRMVGNSVSPPAAKALVRANYSTEQVRKAA